MLQARRAWVDVSGLLGLLGRDESRRVRSSDRDATEEVFGMVHLCSFIRLDDSMIAGYCRRGVLYGTLATVVLVLSDLKRPSRSMKTSPRGHI